MIPTPEQVAEALEFADASDKLIHDPHYNAHPFRYLAVILAAAYRAVVATDGAREPDVEAMETAKREGGFRRPVYADGARELVDPIWDIVHEAGGPFSEESGREQIVALITERDARLLDEAATRAHDAALEWWTDLDIRKDCDTLTDMIEAAITGKGE